LPTCPPLSIFCLLWNLDPSSIVCNTTQSSLHHGVFDWCVMVQLCCCAFFVVSWNLLVLWRWLTARTELFTCRLCSRSKPLQNQTLRKRSKVQTALVFRFVNVVKIEPVEILWGIWILIVLHRVAGSKIFCMPYFPDYKSRLFKKNFTVAAYIAVRLMCGCFQKTTHYTLHPTACLDQHLITISSPTVLHNHWLSLQPCGHPSPARRIYLSFSVCLCMRGRVVSHSNGS